MFGLIFWQVVVKVVLRARVSDSHEPIIRAEIVQWSWVPSQCGQERDTGWQYSGADVRYADH